MRAGDDCPQRSVRRPRWLAPRSSFREGPGALARPPSRPAGARRLGAAVMNPPVTCGPTYIVVFLDDNSAVAADRTVPGCGRHAHLLVPLATSSALRNDRLEAQRHNHTPGRITSVDGSWKDRYRSAAGAAPVVLNCPRSRHGRSPARASSTGGFPGSLFDLPTSQHGLVTCHTPVLRSSDVPLALRHALTVDQVSVGEPPLAFLEPLIASDLLFPLSSSPSAAGQGCLMLEFPAQ